MLLAMLMVFLHFVSALAFSTVERQLGARLRGTTRLQVIYENGRGVLRKVLRVCAQRDWELTEFDADAHDIDNGEVRVTMTLSDAQMGKAPETLTAINGVIAVLCARTPPNRELQRSRRRALMGHDHGRRRHERC